MNRTKNTIGWCDKSWNPITGCLHNCWYCYAKKLFTRFHRSFEPTFHAERLDEPAKLKKPSKIFVCSVADLFAPWTPQEWTKQVLDKIESCPTKHTFQLLTKNPENISKNYKFSDNVWVGTTVTNQEEAIRNIPEIREVKAGVRFVSFEPLLGSISVVDFFAPYSCIGLYGIDWVIVGKLTGSKKVKLNPEWVKEIIEAARYWQIPLFLKDNLNWPEKIQEFPKTRGNENNRGKNPGTGK